MNILEIRCDIEHAKEDEVKDFIKNTLNSNKWMYCKEYKKNDSKKEHFHLMVYTKFHKDTVRRKMKSSFKYLSGKNNEWKVGDVKDIIRYMAYIMKDGDWNSNKIKESKLTEAEILMNDIKEEMDIKKLDEKCLRYLSNFDKYRLTNNGDIMMEILTWFKNKKLKYPSQHWMKSTMIKYWMDYAKDKSEQQSALQKLYCINDAFIKV